MTTPLFRTGRDYLIRTFEHSNISRTGRAPRPAG